MLKDFVKINNRDNVAVALKDLTQGMVLTLEDVSLSLKEDIHQGHKFALTEIKSGENIIKYGYPIGHAVEDVMSGSLLHTHNMKTNLGDVMEYTYEPDFTYPVPREAVYFNGYRRINGKAGIRNEIWIIPTVGCVNSVVTAMERKFSEKCLGENSGTVEKILAFNHPYGCSQMGDDQDNTRRILAGLVNHPNAGGVLLVGLGCENSGISEILPLIGEYDENRVKFLICQDVDDEMEHAEKLIEELVGYAGGFHREKISGDELIIGLKCGGSDGMSGITANPVVGRCSDILTAQGGTAILTEVPEMFGAETLLMARCENKELFDKTVAMINDFKYYFKQHNQTIYENPSPGNKKGGISTLEDKALGCTQKSGSAPVRGVLAYGEIVKTKGLNLLNAPGNDLVAATALAASGAHMVLFTTGRGTPFASPVPTMKISTNTALAEKKECWIDFNCGTMLEDKPADVLAEELFRYILEVASGEEVKSEAAGFHDMAIFKQGVTL